MNISEYMKNEASVKTDYTFYLGFVKRKKNRARIIRNSGSVVKR